MKDYPKKTKHYVEKLGYKDICERFEDKLQRRIANHVEHSGAEASDKWQSIKNCLLAISDILEWKQASRKDWISDDIQEKVSRRKRIKHRIIQAETDGEQLQIEYREANKAIKKAVRRDKRIWAENLAESAQIAADSKNGKELYRITKILANKSITHRQI